MLDRGWAVIVDFLEGSNALVDQSWVVSLGDVVPGCSLALVEGNVRVGGELAVSHISGEAASSEDGESEGNYFLGEELGAAEDSADVGDWVEGSWSESHCCLW